MQYNEEEINIFQNENNNNFKNSMELNENYENINPVVKKRRTNIGCWRDKEEFSNVFEWLFGLQSSKETKMKACRRMTIWKLRLVDLTPASILSTLTIIEVQLKDNSTRDSQEMQLLYSGAFTRFLNYMCSVGQKGKMKTMYQIAMDINIDPFIVDLRHLCSHGQTMPSLNVLRNASEYCLDWLKKFYWDNEFINQQNVDASNVRRKDLAAIDDEISELFLVYDLSIFAQFQGCTIVNEARSYLNEDNYNMFKMYCNINNNTFEINQIQDLVLKNLEVIIRRESTIKNLVPVFIEGFKKMIYIFQIPDLCEKQRDINNVIKTTRGLFRSIAMYGLLERLFNELLYIAENNLEPIYRRKGASFWANEIVLGFIAFNKLKVFCKTQKDLGRKDINMQSLPKMKKIYSKLQIDTDSIIMFGDYYKRPWSLTFTEDYIEEKMQNICEYTKTIIKTCLQLVTPPLPVHKKEKLEELIEIYCPSNDVNNDDNEPSKEDHVENIYYLDNNIVKESLSINSINLESKEKNFGIWSTLDDEQMWSMCPLGTLPWD